MTSFLPEEARAIRLDRETRARLAASLAGLADALAEAGIACAGLRRVAARVPAETVSPAVFALHAGLVDAILTEDTASAERLLALFERPPPISAGLRFVTLDDDLHRMPGLASLYARLAIEDTEAGVTLAPLAPAELDAAGHRAAAALALLSEAAPDLAAELGGLLREVVLVRSGAGSARDFGGASSFHLWGAVILNAERHTGRVAMVEGLVHEAAHLLLFGEAGGERIVVNSDDERHVSPLRDDARPLDGIAHATFVLARMAYALDRLLASDRLTPEERAEAEAARPRIALDYRDGAAVIARRAELTETGNRMLGAAADYMSRAG